MVRRRNRPEATHPPIISLPSDVKKQPDPVIVYSPSFLAAVRACMTARLCSALMSHITDCDETYNYLEPAHRLVYGRGLQTWEYDPKYALRSYAFLWIYAMPVWAHFYFFNASSILSFYFLRCFLGLISSITEAVFYRVIVQHFGCHIGRLTLLFLILSPGMFHASVAFLPSSFCLYMAMISYSCLYTGYTFAAVLSVATSTLLGWPFSCVLGIPIALDVVFVQRKFLIFLMYVVLSFFIVATPIFFIDTYYYGQPVFTPLHLVWYNVFTSHGPNLYGAEPWYFYFFNGILNFNIAFVAVFFSLPIFFLVYYLKPNAISIRSYWQPVLALFSWFIIFFLQSHKEERFLFPVYPLIAFVGAAVISNAQLLIHILFTHQFGNHFLTTTKWLTRIIITCFMVISLMRITALFKAYRAPLDVFTDFDQSVTKEKLEPGLFCIGREWHRFPSQFFFHDEKFVVGFLKSGYKGQLPQPFVTGDLGTMVSRDNFNDLNQEEIDRYVSEDKCKYLVDLKIASTDVLEPNYAVDSVNWTVLSSRPFLISEKSHSVFRAFYIPFLSDINTVYTDYVILKKNNKSL